MRYASSRSNSPETRLRWRAWLLLLGVAMISMGITLAYSAANYRSGFPLDDAWIHQTYARNLALRGEWAFIPGQISGGSTAPLWTIFLAVGHLVGVPPIAWSSLVNLLVLVACAGMAEGVVARMTGRAPGRIPWVGLLFIVEWHLTWAALSGMETVLHVLLVLAVTLLLLRNAPRWFWLGILTGLAMWVRPDGVTLLGPLVFVAFLHEKEWKEKAGAFARLLPGFAALAVPYLIFNLVLTGEIFPTTFYAKQSEYAAWQASPLLGRSVDVTIKFLTGPAILLIPGLLLQGVTAVRKKSWGQVSMFAWMLGFVSIYLLRMPAYQHARYLIPAMAVFFPLGMAGFLACLHSQRQGRWVANLRFAWAATLMMTALGFWFLGMRSYASDVEFIESEMVDTARWVSTNVPAKALVAAHDIGALGYFDQHRLIDLAGLVTPEIIPFLRDDRRLAEYMDDKGVDYLVVFPNWYPTLTAGLQPVFSSGAAYSPSVGGTNLAVYEWQSP